MQRDFIALQWLRKIDKISLLIVFIIITIGAVLIASAGPVVAKKIGLPLNHFIYNQAINISLGTFLLILFSCLNEKQIKALSLLALFIILILILYTLFKSADIKGAKRWLNIFGFSLQPSEFLKPFFAVVSAWLITNYLGNYKIALVIYLFASLLLLLQPDFGMFVILSIIFFSQLFISPIKLIYFPILCSIFFIIGIGAYLTIPHVHQRIDNFLYASSGDNFQIQKAMEAFAKSGLTGVGPAEGKVKMHLPDSHTDFIFAVAGEEFGFILTFIIILLYASLILRNILIYSRKENKFAVMAFTGIISYLAAQVLINISVNLHLLPTKGMTLPFISYGGSSFLASSISIGIILALNKREYIIDHNKYK